MVVILLGVIEEHDDRENADDADLVASAIFWLSYSCFSRSKK